ncbi:MAG: hypothetical protein A2V93_04870 [Ignavibacteria bacterium RBG_16_34_14]|nr:MAG: hypothetical protein A2V93_04870 [Ignavibacteria bacterium RBG_16_34_14]
MRRRSLLIYISILVILIIVFFVYQYLIKIYESTIKIEPQDLFADNQSTVTISVIPLNSFGSKALFRNSPAEFEIVEGSSLVEIKFLDKEEGKLILKAKSETGKVVVKIKSKHSLLPMIVEIPIQPNIT